MPNPAPWDPAPPQAPPPPHARLPPACPGRPPRLHRLDLDRRPRARKAEALPMRRFEIGSHLGEHGGIRLPLPLRARAGEGRGPCALSLAGAALQTRRGPLLNRCKSGGESLKSQRKGAVSAEIAEMRLNADADLAR